MDPNYNESVDRRLDNSKIEDTSNRKILIYEKTPNLKDIGELNGTIDNLLASTVKQEASDAKQENLKDADKVSGCKGEQLHSLLRESQPSPNININTEENEINNMYLVEYKMSQMTRTP